MPDPAEKTRQQPPQGQQPLQDNVIAQNTITPQVPTQDNHNKLEVTFN